MRLWLVSLGEGGFLGQNVRGVLRRCHARFSKAIIRRNAIEICAAHTAPSRQAGCFVSVHTRVSSPQEWSAPRVTAEAGELGDAVLELALLLLQDLHVHAKLLPLGGHDRLRLRDAPAAVLPEGLHLRTPLKHSIHKTCQKRT